MTETNLSYGRSRRQTRGHRNGRTEMCIGLAPVASSQRAQNVLQSPTDGDNDSDLHGFIPSSQTQTCEIVWDCASPDGHTKANSSTPAVDSGGRSTSGVKRHLRTTPVRTDAGIINKAKKKLNTRSNGQQQVTALSLPGPTVDKKRKRALFFRCDLGAEDDSLQDKEDSLNSDGEDPFLALSPIVGLDGHGLPAPSSQHSSPSSSPGLNVTPDRPAPTRSANSSNTNTPHNHNKMNQSFTCKTSATKKAVDDGFSDDSMFNESVIQSTQAIEDALFDKCKNKFVSPANIKAALSKVGLFRNAVSKTDRSPNIMHNLRSNSPASNVIKDNKVDMNKANNEILLGKKGSESNSNNLVNNDKLKRNPSQHSVAKTKNSYVASENSNTSKLFVSAENKASNCPKCGHKVGGSRLPIGENVKCTCCYQAKISDNGLVCHAASSVLPRSSQFSTTNKPNKPVPLAAQSSSQTKEPCLQISQAIMDFQNADCMDDDFDDMDEDDLLFISQVEDEYISSQRPRSVEPVRPAPFTSSVPTTTLPLPVDTTRIPIIKVNPQQSMPDRGTSLDTNAINVNNLRTTNKTTNVSLCPPVNSQFRFRSRTTSDATGPECPVGGLTKCASDSSLEQKHEASVKFISNNNNNNSSQVSLHSSRSQHTNSSSSLTFNLNTKVSSVSTNVTTVSRKCTPEEIALKKAQAIERRKAILRERGHQ